VGDFILPVDELFRSLLSEFHALSYQPSFHSYLLLGIIFKSEVAEILLQRWKQTKIACRLNLLI
jgi:hypothetical protein